MEQNNIIKIGMNTDVSQNNLQKGEYSYALNAAIEDFTGENINLQNVSSNILQTSINGFFLIGKVNILELERTLYFLVNPTNTISKIVEVKNSFYDDDKLDSTGTDNCCDCENNESLVDGTPLEKVNQEQYQIPTTILESNCLNFNINNPIDIEYRITNKGVNLYFTDNLNPLRFIYLDLINDSLVLQDRFKVVTGYDPLNCNLPIYSNVLDCNKIKFNPDYSRPCVEAYTITIGGILKEGVYQALVCYSDELGNPLTKYFQATNTISIKGQDVKVETNNITDKAISFKINNLEQSSVFEYYNVIIAKTIDNFTSFELVATLPITKIDYTYNGIGEFKNLTPNDIFFQKPIYKTAASISKSNGFLFLSNLKEHSKLNLQKAVNRIPVYWQTKSLDEDLYNKEIASGSFRTYMRDEVYPLGLVFEMTDDNDTIAFPLVGKNKAYYQTTYGVNVDQVISNNDVINYQDCINTTLNKRWQLYNTAQIIGQPHQQSSHCGDNNCWEYGDFAYWESTETYPNIPEIWGDLCGQPIRHFKFPDSLVTHIHDNKNANSSYTLNNKIYPIGIKINHSDVISALDWAVTNNIITQEQRNRIKGYRVVRGNRVGNKSITCKGLLFDMWNYNKNEQTIYYGNYPYNDLRQDPFLSGDNSTYDGGNNSNGASLEFSKTGRYTFHSPDTHFTNTGLGNILKLETEEYGKSEGFFNHCEEQSKQKFLSTFSYTLAFSFGVAAAISSLEEKECRTYTVKADIYSKGNSSGSMPYGDVSTNTGGLVNGTGSISTSQATGNWNGTGDGVVSSTFQGNVSPYGNINIANPNNTYGDSGHPAFFSTFDPRNSNIDFWNLTSKSEKLKVSEYTGTTCKGTTYQVLNSNSSLGVLGGLGSLLSGVVSAIIGNTSTVNGVLYKTIIAFRETEIILNLMESLTPNKNMSIQYNSIGKYNCYKDISNNGSKLRYLDNKEYLQGDRIVTKDNIRINNWNRESSVYLKTQGTQLPNPTIVDNSRTTMTLAGLNYDSLNSFINRDISSYYTSLKNYVPNQYGTIYSIDYLETDSCLVPLNSSPSSCKTYFGGDIFISRFALKRKFPFFLQTRFKQLDNADVRYQDLGNVAYPNFYFNSKEPLFTRLEDVSLGDIFTNFGSFVSNKLLGVPKTRLDAKTSKFFYQNGYIHLYNYGIPYFLVESEINCNFRHAENNKEKDFYPRQKDLSYWLQEKNVPISEDNTFFYNKSYSKQNKESVIINYNPKYLDNTIDINNTYNQRIIYSDKQNLTKVDSWLIFRANNYYDINRYSGRVISVDGIEQDKVLVRTENNTQIFNAYETISSSSSDIQVGNNGIFKAAPREFSVTDLGYMSTQHRVICKTEFGHIWVDAKRGSVFLLANGGSSVEEISKNGMRNWFKENLPFQIQKDFKEVNIDNSYKGIGITMSFDKRFSKIYITKLDYKKLDNNITYNPISKKFFIGESNTEVSLFDSTKFCNKSWTISYNFNTQTWTSFHSFKPNLYNDFIDSFSSIVNDFQNNKCTIWGHNLTNKSYQVYYGKLYPFILDVPSQQTKEDLLLKSISYITDVIRYQNRYDTVYKQNVTFNKCTIYNDFKNSGLLKLNIVDREDLSKFDLYPIVNKDSIDIEVTNVNNLWNINDFFDVTNCIENNQPIWIRKCSVDEKYLNTKNINYNKTDLFQPRIFGKRFNIRLENDIYSNYKFIFNLNSIEISNLIK